MYKTLENNIKKIDNSVEAEVYKLYQLSSNDVQVILRSIQPQNTTENLLQAAA